MSLTDLARRLSAVEATARCAHVLLEFLSQRSTCWDVNAGTPTWLADAASTVCIDWPCSRVRTYAAPDGVWADGSPSLDLQSGGGSAVYNDIQRRAVLGYVTCECAVGVMHVCVSPYPGAKC